MQVRYFPDTDTLLIDFSDRDIAETTDINENVLVELDADGGLVSMTIEHAKANVNIEDFSFQNGGLGEAIAAAWTPAPGFRLGGRNDGGEGRE